MIILIIDTVLFLSVFSACLLRCRWLLSMVFIFRQKYMSLDSLQVGHVLKDSSLLNNHNAGSRWFHILV